MKNRNFLTLTALFFFVHAFSQHQELGDKPGIWKGNARESKDSTSLRYAFKQGTTHGHFRYFFMSTDNQEGLTDAYAHAAGGGLRFETARYKGFQMGISGFYTFNMGSSDLTKADPHTGQSNRYEVGLFDQQDPGNKRNIDRLEELFLKYHFRKGSVTWGKQLINTAFINLQDGRMRPTEAGGLWMESHAHKKINIEGGILNRISPRGTTRWFGIGESIGIYSTGVNRDGTKSGYAGNTHSRFLIMSGITWKPSNHISLRTWEMYADNLFNAIFIQTDFSRTMPSGAKLLAGSQVIVQRRLGNGGNSDPMKRYVQDDQAVTFGGQLGWEYKTWKTSYSFNRITAAGRYFMPREWGRDPFYTFMPRERNEGLADVNAHVFRIGYEPKGTRWKSQLAYGQYKLPSVTDFRANKYGMPSYSQFNIDVRYAFDGMLKGLDLQLLYVVKKKTGKDIIPDKYIINKVNMHQWNLVMNYNF